jgi:ABC-type branched-subunit amino acid transport system ATPase component
MSGGEQQMVAIARGLMYNRVCFCGRAFSGALALTVEKVMEAEFRSIAQELQVSCRADGSEALRSPTGLLIQTGKIVQKVTPGVADRRSTQAYMGM